MLDQFRAQKLEWNRANNQIYDRVETSSGDSNGRTLFVQISNGGTVEDLTGATLSLAWNKKTEQGLESFEEVDAKKGQYRLFYPTGMLVNHGLLQASLVLVDVTGRIESKPFDIIVHKGTVDDDAVESDNKFTALTTALVKVSQVQAEFDSLYAEKSQMMDTLHDDKKADMEVLEADYSNRANTLESTYAPRLTEAAAQLAQRPSYIEVRENTNTKPINVSEMDTETKLLFTGGAVAVVGENAVGNENLKNQSVSLPKTDFSKNALTKNLFTSKWNNGSITNANDANFKHTDLMSVDSDINYTLQLIGLVRATVYTYYYDVHQVEVSYESKTLGQFPYTFKTGTTVKFIRIQTMKNNSEAIILPTQAQLEKGVVPTGYVPPQKYWIDSSNLSGVSPEKTDFFALGKNLFTPSWELGTIAGSTGANSPSTESARTTDFVQVTPLKKYTLSVTGIPNVTVYVRYYDTNKQNINGELLLSLQESGAGAKTFTTPEDAVNLRFLTYKPGAGGVGLIPSTIQLELGQIQTDYEPAGLYLKPNIINPTTTAKQIESEVKRTIQYENDYVKSIAHRGYSYGAPETTVHAYKMAKEKGFKYVECDLQFSSDNVPMLWHTIVLSNLAYINGAPTPYPETPINSLTWAELQTYDVGAWFSPEYVGTKMLSFYDFLVLCKKLNLYPYIDIKLSNMTSEQADILMGMVKKLGMTRKMTWMGGWATLDPIRVHDPIARISTLPSSTPSNLDTHVQRLTAEGNVFLNAQQEYVTPEMVDICIQNGIGIEAWIVNDPTRAIELVEMGLTGITTDKLDVAKLLEDSV